MYGNGVPTGMVQIIMGKARNEIPMDPHRAIYAWTVVVAGTTVPGTAV